VSGDAAAEPEPVIVPNDAVVGPLENRFHVVAVACQRVLQIRNGSRPRLDPGAHKPCVVAVAEVVAGTVPYYVS
jgi:DNA-directed RNA polymerase subunit K/omega